MHFLQRSCELFREGEGLPWQPTDQPVASVQRYERYPEDRGDILGVGHAITASKDIDHSADEFLDQLNREESDQFRVMTDF